MYQFKLDFPVPKPDMKRYNKMLSDGFENYPQRTKNYEIYKKSKKIVAIDYFPIKADIENVSQCNLNCSHCLVSTFPNQKRAEALSHDDYKAFINEQYGLIEIKLQGLGEPFLQKNFTSMVEYAASKDIWVRTTTNGTLLHKNDNYKKIIDANIGEIQVSIDGATQETQGNIRVKSDLNIIKENCKLLNSYCDEKGIDYSRMWTVFQDKNLDESKELLYMAKEIGFKRVTFSIELREWENNNTLNEKIKESRIDKIINQEWIDEHLKIANELGINLTFWHATERFTSENICMWPFERLLLSSDKQIVPCCIIADPAISSFGEYKQGQFKELWFGKTLKNFRKAHIEGKIPDICKACYH